MNTIEKALQKKQSQTDDSSSIGIESDSTKPESTSEKRDSLSAYLDNGEEKSNEHPTIENNNSEKESNNGAAKPNNVIIDTSSLEKRGFVSVDSTRRQINEEYRAIKRKLLKNAFGPLSKTLTNSNIIMVSSARPGEGKTFTAINLALSIAAEKDKTVLLVDADVLRPNIAKTLNLNIGEGLIEYLLDEKQDISDVMYTTSIDKLRIIPAGRSHHLSTELLASEKMHSTIDEIASRYPDRVVIIDTPPLIGINETAILTNFAGQAVVVCEEGKARLSDLNKAVSLLDANMAIGFVVNKAIVSADNDFGYYGYYHPEE